MAKQKELFYKIEKNIFELVGQGKLTLLAVNVYMLITDRQRITKFKDEYGSYAVYTIKELQKQLAIKTDRHIYTAIKELTDIKLLDVKKSKGKATKYYTKYLL